MLLADACNEEETVSLGLLITRIGPSWDDNLSTRKQTKLGKHLCDCMNEYFQKIDKIATNASKNPQARFLLQVLSNSYPYYIFPLTMILGCH